MAKKKSSAKKVSKKAPIKNEEKFPQKRLYRSKKERIFGGVCGGIGEYSNTDPTLIRLIWAVATLLSIGTGFLAYLICWIVIPERN